MLLQTFLGFAAVLGCAGFGLVLVRPSAQCLVSKQYLCQTAMLGIGTQTLFNIADDNFLDNMKYFRRNNEKYFRYFNARSKQRGGVSRIRVVCVDVRTLFGRIFIFFEDAHYGTCSRSTFYKSLG